MRDNRDPAILGTQLLRMRDEATPEMGPAARLLSWTYDYNRRLFERMPEWAGNGFMSNDPAEHHSKTPQMENAVWEHDPARVVPPDSENGAS